MKTELELKELSYKRYGTDLHLYGAQRDGFKEGYRMCQESLKTEWIKLNKKATNLPKKDCYCWIRVKDEFGDYHILNGNYSEGGRHFYCVITSTVTHYQIIKKPIYL